jgi:hypothetical protein
MKSFFEELRCELDDFPYFILRQMVSTSNANHKIEIIFRAYRSFNPIPLMTMILFNLGMKISIWNIDSTATYHDMMSMDHDITIECEYDFNRLMIDNQEI